MASLNKLAKRIGKRFLPRFYAYLKEQKMMRFYSTLISQGDLCFDIGANMGNRTSVFLKLGATVVAVEPQAKCISHLEELYKNDQNVSVETCALNETSGSSIMYISDFDQISTLSQEFVQKFGEGNELSWPSKETVEMKTFDQLIEQYGVPDFTKIDVEGFELNVLKGLSVSIPSLSFEFTTPMKYKSIECIKQLMSLGEYQFKLSYYETMKFDSPKWLDDKQILQQLNVIPKHIVHGDVYAKLVKH